MFTTLRNTVVCGLAAVAIAGLPSLAGAADREGEITFFIWAGANQGVVPKEIFADYQAANPKVKINVIESNNTITYPKMVAAKRVTPDQPLVHCGFIKVDSMNKGDIDEMWTPLDIKAIPNMANVITKYRREGDMGVGFGIVGIGLIYNTKAMSTPPDSWTALWDKANRNRVTMFDYDARALTLAARLNGGDERNIDPGFKVWAENAKNLRALVDSNIALKNLLVSGDAWIAPWFGAIAKTWIDEGAPIGFVEPKEGMVAFPIYLTMAAGVTDNQRAICSDLINELLDPKRAGRYAALTNGAPVVKGAVLPPDRANDPMLSVEMAEKAILLDQKHIAKMTPEWRDRWDREVKLKLR